MRERALYIKGVEIVLGFLFFFIAIVYCPLVSDPLDTSL